MGNSVRKVGDWAKARRLLMRGPQRLKKAMTIALKQEAHALRNEIVDGITKQAPGGNPILPLAASTLARRQLAGFGGTKALIVRADLRNSISVVTVDHEVFIGIRRSAKSRDGKSMVDIGQLHEFGGPPVVIPITDKMRKFLAVLAKKQGITPSGSGRGVVVTQVPARPFLRPAFEVWRKGAQERFLARVAWEMGFSLTPPSGAGAGAPSAAGKPGGKGGAAGKGGGKASKKPRQKSARHVAAAKLGWARRRAKASGG